MPRIIVTVVSTDSRCFTVREILRTSVGSFQQFVEFSSVQPDTTALRAVVDFDSLPVSHFQFNFAQWAQHAAILE
jgi:hypothetical protein